MINGKIIKVCGMRKAENIQDVELSLIHILSNGISLASRAIIPFPMISFTGF